MSKIYTRKHRNKSEFSRPKICIFIDNNERLPPRLHSGFSIDEQRFCRPKTRNCPMTRVNADQHSSTNADHDNALLDRVARRALLRASIAVDGLHQWHPTRMCAPIPPRLRKNKHNSSISDGLRAVADQVPSTVELLPVCKCEWLEKLKILRCTFKLPT